MLGSPRCDVWECLPEMEQFECQYFWERDCAAGDQPARRPLLG